MTEPADDPTVLIVTRNRRGRPRAREAMTSVSAWIPVEAHDRLIRYANARELSISAALGRLIARGTKIDEPRE